jgi:pyruvate/2-oxoglutarate dehydrogenase complex dihydrolipoamide dehydrogenase (E3) component
VLTQRLRREGVDVWNGSAVTGARRRDGRKEVSVTTPEGARTVLADEILVAAGRRPSVEGLGLASVGVAVDEDGIRVDRTCRTTVRSIWAVGDVTHTFRFTHWASHQARLVLRNALLPGVTRDERDVLPWTTFTDPEVARVGLSEREARERGIRCEIHRVPFEEIDRAVCDGATEGFAKVLTRRGRILGATIVHAHAGELIGALTMARRQGTRLAAVGRAMHVYPTLGDVHRALADDYLLGRVTPRRRALLARVFAWLR